MKKNIITILCIAIAFSLFSGCGETAKQSEEKVKSSEKVVQQEQVKPKQPEVKKETTLDLLYKGAAYLMKKWTIGDNYGYMHVSVADQKEAIKLMNGIPSDMKKHLEKSIGEYNGLEFDLWSEIEDQRRKANEPYDEHKYSKLYQSVLDFFDQRKKQNGKLTSNDCFDAMVILMKNGEDNDSLRFYHERRHLPNEFYSWVEDRLYDVKKIENP